MSKGSDKNVGSIEEDIKRLEEISKCFTYSMWSEDTSALRRILQDYTRQKQINEEHQKINGELIEKVKELEKNNIIEKIEEMPMPDEPIEIQIDNNLIKQVENLPKDIQIEIVGLCSLLCKNYIPKQKIKNLMEKEKLPLTIVGGRNNGKTLAYGIKLGKIKACEELLQESEDK